MDLILRYKLKRKYADICRFVRVRMPLATVCVDIFLLWVPRDKEGCMWQGVVISHREVMALLVLWIGYLVKKYGHWAGDKGYILA